MITAQDIREKTFEKSKFGGYAMNEVDDFLDELANDLAAAQKESSVLRGKLKVLAEKIDEYRGSEDAMRLALVSAQKIAKEIEADAQAKADALLAEAREKADAILADAQEQADSVCGDLEAMRRGEELRLEKARSSSAEFIQRMIAFTEQEQALLNTLSDMDFTDVIVTPAPAERRAIAAPAEEEYGEPLEEEYAREEEDAPVSAEDALRAFEDAVFRSSIPEAEEEEDEDAPPTFRL